MNRWVDFTSLDSNSVLFISFVFANVFCILVFSVILALNISTKNYETKNRYFNGLLIFEILYFIADIIWALGYFSVISKADGGLTIARYAKMMYFLFGSYSAFCWFMYIEILMGAKFSRTKKSRLIIGIPIIIATITTIIISIITEENKLMNNPLVSVSLMYIPSIYTIFAGVYSIVMAVKAQRPVQKRRYVHLGLFPFMLMIIAILQVFLVELPIFCLGTTFIVTILFISKTQSQISTDALTGLNNRSALTIYIGEYTEFNHTYVLMIDVDKFKLINDNFGHVEGDRALILLSQALKNGIEKFLYKSFLARYGGDEFIIIVSNERDFDIDEYVNVLQNEVANTKEKTNGYEISVSIGYSKVTEKDSILSVIENADDKMYKVKALKKQANNK